ncbi:MAG: helix-turn-helix domain-containing protein [Solirubrobacterales bacterium]|nr:helix-turn-helix domain-containing protein [Solirubrobacterales bacterium]
MKPITEIDDPRLVKGLAHPLRIHILRVLQDRVASPSEIAEELGAPLGNVSYHVRFLVRVGLIELAGTQPRRGAVEHYYRAIGLPEITDQAWSDLPRVVRNAVTGSALEETARMIGAAANAGGFDAEQASVSRRSLALDEQGRSDLAAAVSELVSRAEEIERESAARTADGGSADGGSADGGSADGGSADGGPTDGSTTALVAMLFGVAANG